MQAPLQSQSGFEFLRCKPDAFPERALVEKRRWASFLTWAFVLAEMAGRDAFLPTSAHAADADTTHDGHGDSSSNPIANALPNADVATQSENPEPIAYQHAATMPAYASAAPESALADTKDIPTAELGAQPHLGAGSAGGGGAVSSAQGDATGDDSLGNHAVGTAVGDIGQALHLGLQLDAGETVHDLLTPVPDTLGELPIIGDTLGGLGNTLGSTVDGTLSTLQPLLSLVGVGEETNHSFGNDLGLPGQLHFATTSTAPSGSELVSAHGSYTTYGMALSLDANIGDTSSTDLSTHADAQDAMFDVHVSYALPVVGDDGHSDALHLDQTILKTAADVLA